MRLYTLNSQGEPIEEPDILRWAEWLSTGERTIANTQITDDIRVSTIFLSIDYGFSLDDNHPPILWETMIFGGPDDMAQWRYTGRDQALAHHDQVAAEQRAKQRNTSKSASEDAQ